MNQYKEKEFHPTQPKYNWNCYTPVDESVNDFFLSHNLSYSNLKTSQTHRQAKSEQSDMIKSAPSKISLRSRKERKPIQNIMPITSLKQIIRKNNDSSKQQLETKRSLWGNYSDSLFFHPQTPQIIQKTEDNRDILKFIPTSPSIAFTPLSPPPVITFTHSTRPNSEKSGSIKDECEKNDNPRKNNSNKEANIISSNQSIKKGSNNVKEEFIKINLRGPSIGNSQENKPSTGKQTLSNEGTASLSPPKTKQKITKSLLNSYQLSITKDDKWPLGEEIKSFCSEKNTDKCKIKKMFDVQEIKSQADSEQNNEEDDNESIVLGRLEELSNRNHSKPVPAGVAPQQKNKFTLSSIQ